MRGVASVSLGVGAGCAAMMDGSSFCWGVRPGTRRELPRRAAAPALALTMFDACTLLDGKTSCTPFTGDPAARAFGAGWSSARADTTWMCGLTGHSIECAHTGFGGDRSWDRKASKLAMGDGVVCAVPAAPGEIECTRFDPRSTDIKAIDWGTIRGTHDSVDVSCGAARCCALDGAGAVSCWNAPETLTTWEDAHAEKVPGLAAASQIAVGDSFACAVGKMDGRVWCWGDNSSGELGTSAPLHTDAPAMVPGIADVRSLAVWGASACAIVANDRSLLCWGAPTSRDESSVAPEAMCAPGHDAPSAR